RLVVPFAVRAEAEPVVQDGPPVVTAPLDRDRVVVGVDVVLGEARHLVAGDPDSGLRNSRHSVSLSSGTRRAWALTTCRRTSSSRSTASGRRPCAMSATASCAASAARPAARSASVTSVGVTSGRVTAVTAAPCRRRGGEAPPSIQWPGPQPEPAPSQPLHLAQGSRARSRFTARNAAETLLVWGDGPPRPAPRAPSLGRQINDRLPQRFHHVTMRVTRLPVSPGDVTVPPTPQPINDYRRGRDRPSIQVVRPAAL